MIILTLFYVDQQEFPMNYSTILLHFILFANNA